MDQNVSQPDGANPRVFADSVRALLKEDPRRYRLFGQYWFFVKTLLKRYFDRSEMPLLGDYNDPSVNERTPADVVTAGGMAVLDAAIEEYIENARLNLGRNQVEDSDGQFFTLLDPDIDA